MIFQKAQREAASAVHKVLQTRNETHLHNLTELQLEELNNLPDTWTRDIIAGIMAQIQDEPTNLTPIQQMQQAWREWERLKSVANRELVS